MFVIKPVNQLIAVCLALLFNASLVIAEENSDEVTVYRSASCSCCGKWIEHLEQNHFKVKNIVVDELQTIKERFNIPEKLASCHTAVVNGYVIEGHVPVADIKKLLTEKPAIAGIAAPGMPLGSPGMEANGYQQKYQVMSFDKQGGMQVFASH